MTEHEEKGKSRGPLYDATRMVLMAAIGAASLAQDELNGFVDRLVERGEMAESDARKLMREVLEKRDRMESDRKARESKKTETASPATKADIEALTQRIADLARQIEEIKKA